MTWQLIESAQGDSTYIKTVYMRPQRHFVYTINIHSCVCTVYPERHFEYTMHIYNSVPEGVHMGSPNPPP